MDTKNPKSFMAAKLSARAVETSNMKNAQVFNISYTPGEILIRSELERVTDDLADYVIEFSDAYVIKIEYIVTLLKLQV